MTGQQQTPEHYDQLAQNHAYSAILYTFVQPRKGIQGCSIGHGHQSDKAHKLGVKRN